jgi:hypothetical protein
MSAHGNALEKAKKHTHKKGDDGKCTVCDMVVGNEGKVDDKGKKASLEYSFTKNRGAKNNDTEND